MKGSKTFISNSPSQTKKSGKALATKILKRPPKKSAVVIALKGDLGGGKTTFLQGFASGLGVKEKVLSPTFIIFRKHEIKKRSFFKSFFHFDCYRIRKPGEVLPLGFKNIISAPQNIVAIEWAERIEKILPRGIITLDFEFINKTARKIHVS